MATLEWCDGFDHYEHGISRFSFATYLGKKWTSMANGDDSTFGISSEYARPGAPANGQGYRTPNNGGHNIIKTLPSGSQATRCLSFWWYGESLSSNQMIGAFYDAGAEQLSIRTDGSSKLIVSRNGTTLFTSTNAISAATWYHFQFKATINNTTGAYEVKVNGSSTNWVPSQTGANTRGTGSNNSANQISIGATASWRFDDVVVSDDFPGQVAVAFLQGVAAGNYQQWTPNSGDNHGAVSGGGIPDGDNSFNSDTTSGHIDTFVMEDLPSGGSPTILGIQHVLYAKQDAGVARTIRPKQRSSGTDYSGTSVALGASYVYITEAVSTNPATSAAYTKADIDGAEFGYENV